MDTKIKGVIFMPTLYHWRLAPYDGKDVLAHGLVTGHPKLPNGLYCHTSPIQAARLEDDALTLETFSGSRYVLRPEAMAPNRLEETAAGLEKLGLAPGLAERWAQARREADELRRARQTEELAPGELLLEVVGTNTFAAFFRSAPGELVEVEPDIHVGMFQDSVLVTDWEGGTVDFRYFPKGDRLEPYHISDGLTAIRLSNLGSVAVTFGGQGREVLCPAGEVTFLSAAEHEAEGLFSPDAVNGKGLYSKLLAKKPEKDEEH